MKKHSLSDTYPKIASEWDYEKNKEFGWTPETVYPHSDKKVWWRCKDGHSYSARIDHRTRMHSGCPYCAGKRPIIGVNDFAALYPELAQEWDYDNNNCPPEEYLPASNKAVSWICPICSRSYKRKIFERTLYGFACPDCMKESHTSKQEQTIFYYLSKVVFAENRKRMYGKEMDVYIPSLNIGVEYNGEYYHSNKSDKDIAKYSFLKDKGVRTVVIQCGRFRDVSGDTITLMAPERSNPTDEEFTWGLSKLFEAIKLPAPDIDLQRDMIDIYCLYVKSVKENSVAVKCPEIAKEWNYKRNKNLRPDSFSYGSDKKVWWTCSKCGNDYDMVISSKTVGNTGCPYCSGKRIKIGFNDLRTTNPELIPEWNVGKNERGLEQYGKGSDKKVWWICKAGHEWEATISSRTAGKAGCPVCAGRQVLKGYNDIATTSLELLKIWNYDKNKNGPGCYTMGSNQRVWWKCDICGHEWKAQINSINRGRRCPECAKQNRPLGRNKTYIERNGSLAENAPELIEEWDYGKNELGPEQYTPGSDKKIWWKCGKCGHGWQASPYQRVAMRQGCPVCGKIKSEITREKQRLEIRGPLSEHYPDLIQEWDYDKNELGPEKYTSGSKKAVWWKCVKGHSWQAVIYSRAHGGAGCPQCAGRVKVKNLDTGEIFNNYTLAGKSVGVTRAAITFAVKNNTKCKGYRWGTPDMP